MEQKQGTDVLEKAKWGLIEEAKRLDRLIYGRKKEKEALEGALSTKKDIPPVGRLRKELEEGEFKIATEAFTRKQEKDMITKIRQAKAGLEEALQISQIRNRLHRILAEMPTIEKQRQEIEAKIAEAKGVISKGRLTVEKAQYQQARDTRRADYEKRKAVELEYAKRREEEKKDMDRYMAKDEALELGQIAVIRKKKKHGGEEQKPTPQAAATTGAGGAGVGERMATHADDDDSGEKGGQG